MMQSDYEVSQIIERTQELRLAAYLDPEEEWEPPVVEEEDAEA